MTVVLYKDGRFLRYAEVHGWHIAEPPPAILSGSVCFRLFDTVAGRGLYRAA